MNQTPRDLIDSSGRPRFGVYYQPIEHINLDRFDFLKVAPLPFKFLKATSRLAIKRWQYVGLVSHDIILGMAVIDISYVRSAFVYTYVRGDGRVRDHSFLDPLKRQTHFSSSSIDGMSSYESRGVSLKINNNVGSGRAAHLPGSRASSKPTSHSTRRNFHLCVRSPAMGCEGLTIATRRLVFRSPGVSGWVAISLS